MVPMRSYVEVGRFDNGEARLTLLRQHQRRVTAQITALTECLSPISFKVQLCEASLADGFTDPLITPTGPADEPATQQDH